MIITKNASRFQNLRMWQICPRAISVICSERKWEYLNNLSYKASWQDTAPLINLNGRALDIDEIKYVDVFKG